MPFLESIRIFLIFLITSIETNKYNDINNIVLKISWYPAYLKQKVDNNCYFSIIKIADNLYLRVINKDVTVLWNGYNRPNAKGTITK
jgi:hypothetical protein